MHQIGTGQRQLFCPCAAFKVRQAVAKIEPTEIKFFKPARIELRHSLPNERMMGALPAPFRCCDAGLISRHTAMFKDQNAG